MDSSKEKCKTCGELFMKRGMSRHAKACNKTELSNAKNKAFAKNLKTQQQLERAEESTNLSTGAPTASGSTRRERYDGPDLEFGMVPLKTNIQDMSQSPAPPDGEGLPDGPKLDDIRRTFHPHSGLPPENLSLEEYLLRESSRSRGPPTQEKPWVPFRTRLDFEVSEFAQENMLNRRATDRLISLIRHCAANPDDFTITNHADMNKQWDLASKKCTEFQKYDVSVNYKGVEQTFEMHARPLWDWCMDLIQDPQLAPFLTWDAERTYRFNGSSFVRFYTEPWMADAYWDTQSKLPKHPDAKPCPLIVYADKAKLSSFGTQKAYPIVARLANMVVGIRNSNQWGGGQIVGSLPVVSDDTAESGKPGYANFKNAVWHAAFYKLLESISMHSKTGIWAHCGDGKDRWLFPMVLILAADYEEAAVMTLIRGLRGLFPCPICLVKSDKQSDVTVVPESRSTKHSHRTIQTARTLNAEGREDLLKGSGLRNVDNVFWTIAHSDPHKAISFDRLHSHHSGLWGDHLFGQLKLHVSNLGNRQSAKLDQQFDKLPRWRNLNHFQTITNISFNDGSKHEDISKMILFAVHNILTDPLGLKLLACIRSYIVLDMYLGFELHTTETIATGRQELQNFGALMKKYWEACKGTDLDDKNWNFPKMHLHTHAFDDIERKGVTKNFGTKIDEAMHGPARAAYLRQTNFKNVEPQILRSLHRRMVGKYIRDQMDDLDKLAEEDDEPQDHENDEPSDLEVLGNVVVGAKKKPISFLSLQNEMNKDAAFQNFRIRFSDFLSGFLQAHGLPLPGGKRATFIPEQEITPYQYLKVFFRSLDNWADETDYLRCSPSFHNRERYDAAIVKTTTGNVFVRLVYVFTCTIEEKVYPFALVQALDVGTGQRSAKDKALGFYRIRERERKKAEFISIQSIIRGALLAPDFDKPGDYLVADDVDSDMFLRLKAMYSGRTRQ
ncbi:hypothetical protein DFH07DRAFT_785677 [Mycena maculata]|uniref:Uncharacterized protein n=1 Tax=Mycena maculata TaxID=230809 RepID=A0AAD7H9E8_9AGAR|nr:hypothetical protein DFH07DRAFT_785677 [Mycena maculata]